MNWKGAILKMTTEKLTEGLPARIILETTIAQEGEIFKTSIDEMGRIVLMNNNYYLRFEETKDDKPVPTLIKLDEDGDVHITRHGENKTRLVFNENEDTFTNFTTPTGIMHMRVNTERISSSYSDSPFAGEIEVDYVIYLEDYPLGTYQIRLRFTT